jgi:hypothetical protein
MTFLLDDPEEASPNGGVVHDDIHAILGRRQIGKGESVLNEQLATGN